ncbi:glycoside hydrolase family 75 protein [Streptomyces sp. LaPpAH-108]|uniref:glycoside hydrolase family 75 protein n=1 Tax=Streptomyces sp. LaPpAH-108 TaxID=1155714 RepID=UPI0003724E4A|nr:glycoside hydrolase family 75 protein [Streptomyces sp. LaPpAH-108]
MRVRTLTLAATGVALLAPTANPAAASVPYPKRIVFHGERAVSAAQLRRAVGGCDPISRGRYRLDAGTPARVRICGTREAVHWKADLDIDCDGRPTAHCNHRTDPTFAATTAFRQSDGRMLNAEKLPYIVVPPAGPRWSHRAHGIKGGSVAAVLYRDRVVYAVVGDTGPRDVIGEASYATARALGIDPDPRYGGAPSGVTYIVFKDARARHIEDRAQTTALGKRLARRLVRHVG